VIVCVCIVEIVVVVHNARRDRVNIHSIAQISTKCKCVLVEIL
jgi:hypothetical protein